MINGFVVVQIHRKSIYHSTMPCDFIRNVTWSHDVSIESCIWKCNYEQDCQTAIYFHDLNVCSMFYELCKMDAILSSGNIRTSVICNQKDHSKLSIRCNRE